MHISIFVYANCIYAHKHKKHGISLPRGTVFFITALTIMIQVLVCFLLYKFQYICGGGGDVFYAGF